MGQLALAAKITHVPSMYLSELPGQHHVHENHAQNEGDGVKIDNLVAYQNYRPYFVYGVTSHQVKIFNRNNRSSSGAVNICRQVG